MPGPKPLDLGYTAISLAGAVEAAMAAIYELQSDISNNTLTRSTSIVNGLRGSRSSLHNEFEVYIALLEDSQRYVKEYLTLFESTNHRPEFRLTFAKELSASANSIHKQAVGVQKRQENIRKYFRGNKTKIANVLSSGAGVQPAATYPNSPNALVKSYDEVEKIGVYLQQMVDFWDGHRMQISRCTSQDALQKLLGLGSSSTVWKGYLPLLQRSIESITYSSDMVLVDPPITTRSQRPNEGISFLGRLLYVFGFRR